MYNWNSSEFKPLSKRSMEETARKAVAGDKLSIDLLVTSNLKLCAKIAYKYSYLADVEDLTSEGVAGLITAIKTFDVDKGVKFTTHAHWRIKANILKYLLDNNKLVKVGTTKAQKKCFYRMASAKFHMESEGLDVNDESLAARLDVSVKVVREMRVRMCSESSFDATTAENADGDAGKPLHDTIAGTTTDPEVYTTDSQSAAWVASHMSDFRAVLTGKDAAVWDYRIAADKPLSLDSVGADLGCSRQYVNQTERRLQAAFVKYARNRGGR
jgi:RNA polymerase sigma-32 factor